MALNSSHYSFGHIMSPYIVLIVLLTILSFGDLKTTKSPVEFPYRPKPGLGSPKKIWWAKPVTEDLFVAGRLTDRQIKYASEAGFKSIVSLFTYADDELGDFGSEHVPATNEARFIAEDICELQYVSLLGEYDDWASVDAVKKLSAVIPTLKRPILLHCNRGYTITFVTMMYLANQTRLDPNFRPVVNSKNFYETVSKMGLDFSMDFTKETVAEITGEEMVESPPLTDAFPEEWLDYWPAIPVYKNWYIAGQINKYHLSVLEATGFKSVINMRLGLTTEGKPSQEIVTLLNVNDKTSTYKNGGRQLIKNLKKARIDKNKSPVYLFFRATENFEQINRDEFGDEVGYNEDLERQAVENTTLLYHHMAVDPDAEYSDVLFKEHMEALMEVGKMGPVLLHCASATRVAYVGVLAAAYQYGKDLDWAQNRLRELGREANKDELPDVYYMFKAWLKNSNIKSEL